MPNETNHAGPSPPRAVALLAPLVVVPRVATQRIADLVPVDPAGFGALLANAGYTVAIGPTTRNAGVEVRAHAGGLRLIVAYTPRTHQALRASARLAGRPVLRARRPADVEDFVVAALSCQCPTCWAWLDSWLRSGPDRTRTPTAAP